MAISKYRAKKLISRMAKVLGSLGGSVKNKNRTHESYAEAGRLGGLAKGIKARKQKELRDSLLA